MDNNALRMCLLGAALITALTLQGCIVAAVVGTTVGVATSVVGTAVDVTGAAVKGAVKVGGAVVDAATPTAKKDGDEKRK